MINEGRQGLDESRAYWDFFVTECVRQKAPLYVKLSEGVRDDEWLSALAAKARPGQPRANLLFGAVHYLLLKGAEHPLREHYRTLSLKPTPDRDPFPLFKEFCRAHENKIAALIADRVTNTNEVGRAAYLRPGFITLAAEEGGPLHLIELGPSAGLNLHWRRYRYRYVTEGKVHDAGRGEFTLTTALIGGLVPSLDPEPPPGLSIGLERDPVDLGDPDARDWLMALIWPDHPERFRRLQEALAATAKLPLDIRAGDASSLLPEALAECPRKGPICVAHTMTTYQFSREEREALDDVLVLASVRRPLWRLSMEWEEGLYPLKLARYDDGAKRVRVLALCDPQGGSLEWRDERSP